MISRSVSPARSNGSLSDGSEGSSGALSDVLANSQLGSASSPATSHGSRSSTEGSSSSLKQAQAANQRQPELRARKHGKGSDHHNIHRQQTAQHQSGSGGVEGHPAAAPAAPEQHEPDRAHLIDFDTMQLIHRLAALLHNLTKTNDGLRPHDPSSTSCSPTSPHHSSSGGTPGPLLTPELAQTSLARCTPQGSPVTGWPEQSSSLHHHHPQAQEQDYFSIQPQRHAYKKKKQHQQHAQLHQLGTPAESPTREFGLRTPCGEPPDLTGARIAYNSRNPTICFQARNIPAIGIEQYLLRIQKCERPLASIQLAVDWAPAVACLADTARPACADCPTTNEVYIALLIYFDRLTCLHATYASSAAPKFALDSYNVHRLLIAGLAVGSKFLSDIFYTNSRYAKVGGLPLAEFNQLELQLLMLLDFRLEASADHILKYANALLLSDEAAFSQSKPEAAAAASSSATPQQQQQQPHQQQPPRDRLQQQQQQQQHLYRDPSDRPTSRESCNRASSESGSSTIGGRSDCSSVCSTGTIVHAPSSSCHSHSSSAVTTDSEHDSNDSRAASRMEVDMDDDRDDERD